MMFAKMSVLLVVMPMALFRFSNIAGRVLERTGQALGHLPRRRCRSRSAVLPSWGRYSVVSERMPSAASAQFLPMVRPSFELVEDIGHGGLHLRQSDDDNACTDGSTSEQGGEREGGSSHRAMLSVSAEMLETEVGRTEPRPPMASAAAPIFGAQRSNSRPMSLDAGQEVPEDSATGESGERRHHLGETGLVQDRDDLDLVWGE